MKPEDLRGLLKSLGLQRIVARNKDFQALCPFHSERNPSWGIAYEEPHMFGCFGCGVKGTLTMLLVRLGGYEIEEAERITGLLGSFDKFQFKYGNEQPMPQTRNPAYLEVFPKAHTVKLPTRYMRKRLMVMKSFLKSMNLRWDKEQKRVVFPWFLGNDFYGATGRDVTETNEVKTLPYFQLEKRGMFYLPQKRFKPSMVLVEGEIDALSIARLNPERVGVAALGNGTLSKDRLRLLVERGVTTIYEMFDNDKRGFQLRRELHEWGPKNGVATSQVIYYYKDPAQIPISEMLELIKSFDRQRFSFALPDLA